MNKEIQGEGPPVFLLVFRLHRFHFPVSIAFRKWCIQRLAVKAVKPLVRPKNTFPFTRNRLIHQCFKRKVKEVNLS
ncbi:hypothetical protein [uncultured Bacteroides sp.]|uniref:hypothetical protein n=1 Tax=uncultured Bacteroides sp. TaxID=162156 RepID=UPI0025D16EA0|nr:hypothetical protein [uncultured Bacteroides sp.]